jgi:hypothetical protein
MKQLVNVKCYVSIGNDPFFYNTSIFDDIRYIEMNNNSVVEYELNTFEEALLAVKNRRVKNAVVRTTLFKKRPTIELSLIERETIKTITEKNFKPLKVKWEKKIVKSYTIKELSEELPAEQFCEYLKDHK